MPGEIVPVQDGAMGDGVFFRQVVIEFVDVIDADSYNFWQLQFLLPFAVVHMVYVVLGFELEPDTLISGIRILNLIFIGLTVYWYFQLTRKLRSSTLHEVLGFILLFGSFAVLKDYWFNPFVPGVGALMIAMGQANYFVRYEKSKLLLISILGALTWPTLLLTGAILLLMPGDKLVLHANGRPKSAWPVLLTAVVLIILSVIAWQTGKFTDTITSSTLTVIAILSIGVLTFFTLLLNPVDWKKSWKNVARKLHAQKITSFIALIGAAILLLWLLSGRNDLVSLGALWESFWSDKLTRPLDFFAGHIMYWGLLIPVCLVFFPRMLKETSKLGFGMVLIMVLMVPFVLHPESRLLVPFVPFLVLLVLKSTRRYTLISKDLYILGGLALVLSMFWVRLDVPGMGEALASDQWSSFPAQRYGMHFGNHQSFTTYLAALTLGVGMLWILRFGMKRYGGVNS